MNKVITEGNRGAINALKGYRIQALYSICRILEEESQKLTYIPEGIEDLDIYDNDKTLLECIQIKSTVNSLTLSDLISEEGSSFFRRAIVTLEKGHRPRFEIKCFGRISQSLLDLFSNDTSLEKFTQRFKKYDLIEDYIIYLKENTFFESLTEEEYQAKTKRLIKDKVIAADSTYAVEYLHYWLLFLSEKGGTITKDQLLSKLNKIGKFINERENFHRHIHSSIRVIGADSDNQSAETLTESFYQGAGVKYPHIAANLDVKRHDKLEWVSHSFLKHDSVIIHGASGQGKSALAYRFIKDYYPMLSYEVILLDRIDSTLEQIQALKAISKSLDIPILIYIDVPPGNNNWIQILKDFTFINFFKFLITIREEDWNRTSGKGTEFTFDNLSLSFTEEEARLIYENLSERLIDRQFTDFDEAWLRFGGEGPLLEFTYLITQGKTLRSRIEGQLNRIANENPEFIDLLKLVGFSDWYGARIRVVALQNSGSFEKLRIAVSYLEKEYLLQYSENELWLVGLHPIRSKILTELLHFGSQDLESTCIKSISFIEGEDLFILLTKAFQNDEIGSLAVINKLYSCEWDDFTSIINVCNSMIWLGIKNFIENNVDLIDEIYGYDSALLTLRSYLDFTGTVSSISFLEDNESWKEKSLKSLKLLKDNGLHRDEIFELVKKWLEATQISTQAVKNNRDLHSFGELLFWLGYLLPKKKIHVDPSKLFPDTDVFSVQSFSRAMFGMHTYGKGFEKIAIDFEEQFLNQIHSKYKIGLFERDEDSIKAHFILDLFSDYEEEGNIPHKKKLEIIDALRYGLPYLKKHGAKGYGHKLNFLPIEFDDSHAEIPIENNPIEYLVSLNSTLYNLYIYRRRNRDWSEYVNEILRVRSEAIEVSKNLLNVLETYNQKNRKQSILNEYAIKIISDDQTSIDYNLLFPQIISDEIGLVSEGDTNKNKQSLSAEHTISILNRKFRDYRDKHNDLFRSLDNFYWQSSKCIIDKLNLSLNKHSGLLRTSLLNIFDAYERIGNYQHVFREHFLKYVHKDELMVLESDESNIYRSIAFAWKHIVNPTKFKFKKSIKKESFDYLEKLRKDFVRRIERDCLRASEGSEYLIDLKPYFIHNLKTVVIVADLIDALDNYNALSLALNVYKDCIGECRYLSLKHLMLDLNCNNFWVITSVNSKIFHCQAYKFQLHQFTLKSIDELEPFSFIPGEVDRHLVNSIGLSVQPDLKGKVAFADSMIKYYQELVLSVGIASQLFEMAELDGHSKLGETILKEEIQKSSKRAGSAFSELTGNLAQQLEYFQDIEQWSQLDQEYFDFISEISQAILPEPNEDAKEKISVTLNLKQINEWKVRLEGIGEKVGIIYFFLLQRSIEEE